LALLAGASAAAAQPGAGGSPAVHRSGTITNQDYPASALRDRAEGIVVIRLAVGADGRVAGCAIERSSGHHALDGMSCGLATRRFRFNPAVDAKGSPREDVVIRTVRWSLPPPPPPLAPPAAKPH
jgi:protein TonB